VSIEPVGRMVVPARSTSAEPPADGGQPHAADECLDFVRFCYRRRRVAWPVLYDEMAAVAARGLYQGLGYAELAEHGIRFCLPDLPRLAALAEQVMLEERTSPEPHAPQLAPTTLSMAPARS
jgi:hypothetical protein